jgi:hypothetical protein
VSTVHDLRAANFGNRKPAFHYMVFAHRATVVDEASRINCPDDPVCPGAKPKADSTGSADLPGDDSIISFGALMDGNGEVPPEPFLYATTIMHELGHNLGLKHGGPDACIIDKPNFVSVMNPQNYQLNGIPVADGPGSNNYRTCSAESDCGPPTISTGPCATANACHCTTGQSAQLGFDYCYRVDYSNTSMISLNESASGCDGSNNNCTTGGMSEAAGVGGPANDEDVVLYYIPGGSQLPGASNGSGIDWDNNGNTTGAHIKRDVNNDSGYTLLTTSNDWNQINLKFQCTGGYGNGGTTYWATNESSTSTAAANNSLYPPRKVTIDVRPGCGGNWLVVGSSATVPVALYGEATFNVTTVNQSSARLAGAAPSSVSMSDLNGDGRQDLLFNFAMNAMAIDATTTKVVFTASRTVGQTIFASSTVTIVPGPGPAVVAHNNGTGYAISILTHNGYFLQLDLSDCIDSVTDRCGGSEDINTVGNILRITSDENADPGGSMVIIDSNTFWVRMKRDGGGNGRVYTVIFNATDGNGTTQSQCKIEIEHDTGWIATDDGVHSCVGTGC